MNLVCAKNVGDNDTIYYRCLRRHRSHVIARIIIGGRVRLLLLLYLAFIYLPAYAENPIALDHIYLSASTSYELLREKGFKPRKDVPPWPVSLPIAWNADPFGDRNWRFQLHAWRLIDPILLKYRDTQDKKYLEESIEIINDWYQYHYILRKVSKYQWYDMAAGIRAMKLAWLWNEIDFENFSEGKELKQIFDELMELHVTKLINESFLASDNHAYFQLVGLRLLCKANPTINLCIEETEYNNNKMKSLLSRQFTGEGVHRENSPGYHIFTINVLKRLDIAKLYDHKIADLIQRAERVIPWLIYPDGTIVRIGDSSGKFKHENSPITDIYTINDRKLTFGNYIDSGYFSLRTPFNINSTFATQIIITGISNADATHKHADELSFELFHRGRLVFVDSGKYSYNLDDYREYILSASAHNTLSFAGYPIGPKDVSGSGSKLKSIRTSNEYVHVFGHVSRPDVFDHFREFRIKPFEEIHIKDTFKKTLPFYKELPFISGDTSVTSNLHINPFITVQRVGENKVQLDDLAIVELFSSDCKLEIIKAQEVPLLGWVSFEYNDIKPTNVIRAYCANNQSGELKWKIMLL